MKIKHYLFSSICALLLGLTSCSKDVNNTDLTSNTDGSTYMSVSLKVPAQMRAESSNYNSLGNWEGQDDIKSVDIYLIANGDKTVEHRTVTVKAAATNANDGTYETDAWKTIPGNKKVYVVVNNGGAVKSALNAATADNFDSEYRKAYDMVQKNTNGGILADYAKRENSKDVVIMSGEPVDAVIAQNVKEGDAKTKNNVKVNVRRAVSRTAVTINESLNQGSGVEIKTTTERTLGKIKDLKWTVAQYEKTSFLLSNNDGRSPHWDYIPALGSYNQVTAGMHYDYSLLQNSFVLGAFTRNVNNNENIKQIVKSEMKFITETTHQSGSKLGDTALETGYRRGNTTYVMVTGTFVPDDNAFASGEKESYMKDQTIYLGTIDGKFYVNKEKAKAANKQSDPSKDGVIEYKTGKMYYFAWLNPDSIDATEWKNSPVYRNNIYHVNIAGFSKLGFSGNPYNPDPNNPNKPDPDDPTPKPEDPIYDQETYMATEITVINWGMHSYDIKF
ncbi:Mfa1 family fimbria major subunit [Porphyromonas pogonae]|uniref:Mfa1 family fimbria major subunit n=1 Tax=Porphyromonas pogonae TaxID=867595 RepID=UPI002E76BD75|nr:Mfa1 family fimbria major subunit [Porphyromonas pogonae]